MLNVGLSEMLVILVVGCLVTEPKKIPSLLRSVGVYYRKFVEVREEVLTSMRAACYGDDAENSGTGLSPKKHMMGDDGVLHEAYDIGNLVGQHNNPDTGKPEAVSESAPVGASRHLTDYES
ncbi:MAG: Sec-independent protein translocase subunit TatB [Anaplasma sp.]